MNLTKKVKNFKFRKSVRRQINCNRSFNSKNNENPEAIISQSINLRSDIIIEFI